MGVLPKFSTHRGLVWVYGLVFCALLLHANVQVQADSQEESDLVFDSLSPSNLNNHHRISRESDSFSQVESSQEENWFLRTVNRIKRSIDRVFSNEDKHSKKHEKGHSNEKNAPHHSSNRLHSDSLDDHHPTLVRTIRQHPYNLDLDEDDYGQDEDIEDERGPVIENGFGQIEDDYDFNGQFVDNEDEDRGFNISHNEEHNGFVPLIIGSKDDPNQGPGFDDEDRDFGSGLASGEHEGVTEQPDFGVPERQTTEKLQDHPKYYRFTITAEEFYNKNYTDRNSPVFRDLASKIEKGVNDLFSSRPGEQIATVISIEAHLSDIFKTRVTIDLESIGWYDDPAVVNVLRDQIQDKHEIGEVVVSPDNFQYKAFEGKPVCDEGQLPCESGQCVPSSARCNEVFECNDKSDEEGCSYVSRQTTPPLVEEIPTTVTTTTTTSRPITTTPSIIDFGSGDGEPDKGSNRADDILNCRTAGEIYYGDQRCDGTKQCSDGSDEEGCQSAPNCARGEYSCDFTRCIPISDRCNGFKDCSDETDEQECDTCLDTDFHCKNGFCIPHSQRCDGTRHCQDSSDELNCEKLDRCEHYQWQCQDGQCIDQTQRCNHYLDCADVSDELNCTFCTKDSFRCNNGTCVSISHRCDGHGDCPNSEDEEHCAGNCMPSEFRCNNGECIKQQQYCNGKRDCNDGSDESSCDESIECLPDSWKCEDRLACVNESKLCDGKKDCWDSSDEKISNCLWISSTNMSRQQDCPSGQFKCSEGFCIMGYKRCNGINDCDDKSDEENCPTQAPETQRNCTASQFTCADGSCINQSFYCDDVYDCADSSDEINCHTDNAQSTPRPQPHQCYPDQIACRDGTCTSGTRCDRIYDCLDGTDEENCQYYCPTDAFQCNDGTCIDTVRKCDKRRDCPDGSDEANCGCGEYEFQCSPNICIDINRRCDGQYDCLNQEDELNCPTSEPTCHSDEFLCQTNSKCIPRNNVCNGKQDCPAGEDETNCQACLEPEWFECEDGSGCINSELKCDNVYDCKDFSDEQNCFACDYYREFECANRKCVDRRLRCNGYPDCTDSSDEFDCPTTTQAPTLPPVTVTPRSCPFGYVSCTSEDQCILRSQLCDGRVDCRDLSDESNCGCGIQEFRCENGPCINRRLRCDGKVDCLYDISDELDCVVNSFWFHKAGAAGLQLRTYPSQQDIKEKENFAVIFPLPKYNHQEVVFQCRDEGPIRAGVVWRRANGLPLPPGSRDINGRLEMPNIKVEHGGTYVCVAKDFPPGTLGAEVAVQLHVDKVPEIYIPPPVKCNINESTCANGDCIPRHKVCDSQFDCSDGSDEVRCKQCEPNEFKCDNKKCVSAVWKCDGQDDCGDGSDERFCRPAIPGQGCGSQQFTCTNEQCVPRSFHCDGFPDCIDRSDEIGCLPPSIAQNPPAMISLSVGQTFTITCRAVGVPTPEIMWRLNWHHVPTKCRMTSENGYGTLICENIQIEDQGAYSCEALSTIATVFAKTDTILTVTGPSVCRAGYFNVEARSESECIKCFCFGHTSNCRSADLYTFQFQPPFDSLKLLGVRIDPITGVIDIRDEPIYKGVEPQLQQIGTNGVRASIPYLVELNQPNVGPYFALPENYHGNQLKSYGGYLKYTVRHSNTGRPIEGPDVILTGNNYILLHESRSPPPAHLATEQRVRFFEDEWTIKSYQERSRPATREEVMMALEDVNHILIKLEYNEGYLNTTLSNIEMDSAAIPDSGLGTANYVEECSCPVGYTGTSCENCAEGYVRHESGQWLGQCYKEPTTCPPLTFFDGRECQPCPCPNTSPSNQFARSCHMNTDGNVVCNCQPGYSGLRCEYCAPGYTGNPIQPGDTCRASSPCDPSGTLRQDSDGRCVCKEYTTGPYCNLCQPNSFHLNVRNQFGCISCFCMGVTRQCSSSSWYRDSIESIFTSSLNDFKLTDILKEDDITEGIRLNQDNREIVYNLFREPEVYYWSLPNKYLGDKVSSYGGYLRYTIRNTPVPGGASSRNNAPDVELVSENHINLQYFATNVSQSTNSPQTFVVPLLEQYWQRNDGVKTDREHLLMALADVRAIYIKATYFTNTQESALISVSLDIASEYNTGRERAYEVEQCHCPPGYTGLSCEDCAFGYTRSEDGLYLELCKPCECNGFSNECDPETGVCRNCRQNTAGDQCDQCLPGFTGDPTRGQSCAPQGPTVPCVCDTRGSTYSGCVHGVCQCKANVEGPSCDRCRNGTFGLSTENIDGCEFCFCSGVSTECSQSNLYVEQIPVQITENHHFILTDQYFKETIKSGFKTNLASNEISYTFPPSRRERMYWSLPPSFTGNQIKSYGGKLEYMQMYGELPESHYFLDKDVIITGNDVVIYWSNPSELQPSIFNRVSVRLHPSANWFRLDQNRAPKSASREDILTVLANIDTILVRATLSTDTSSTFLSDITLDTAVEIYTGKPLATNVEICRCPEGHRGTSCESCASGYYKDLSYSSTQPLGSCKPCPCQNHEYCEFDQSIRGVVCHCLPGYVGRYCDQTNIPKPSDPDNVSDVRVIMSPPKVVAPIGQQIAFTCTYLAQNLTSDLRIVVENHNSGLRTELKDFLRVNGGAQASFYAVVGCTRQTVTCYILNRRDTVVGSVSVALVPAEIITTTRRPSFTDPTPNPPTIDVIISGHNIEIYQIGSSVRLNCSAVSRVAPSSVRIDWSKDNDRLPSKAIDDGSGILYIPSLTTSDSGRYSCLADDGYSVVSKSIDIIVGDTTRDFAPIIHLSSPYIQVSEGQLIEVRCSATGNPTPEYSLSRTDRHPLNPSHFFENGVFRIHQARVTDGGSYRCTVDNRAGQDSKSFEVQVSVGSVLQVEIEPKRYEGRSGDQVILKCIADRAQYIRWSKDSGPLPYQYRDENGLLIIPNAGPSDSGTYICTATSYDGTRGTQFAFVTIQDDGGGIPPTAKISPETIRLRQGETIEVRCEVTGAPTPVVKWTRSNGELTGNAEQIGHHLHITNARIDDRGTYICAVSNILGADHDAVQIDVSRFEQPLIQIVPEGGDISATSGNSVQLQCRVVQGYPAPRVTWARENAQPLGRNVEVMTGGNLRIIDITPAESGEYVCSAENEAGRATAIAHITVNNPPVLTVSPDENIITRAVNEHLQLVCHGSGDPQPTVSWIKATSIDYYSITRELSIAGPAYLEFTRLRPEDAGIYVCIGRNVAGVNEKRVQLDILPERGDNPGGDQGSIPVNIEEFNAIAGARAELKCKVTSSDDQQHYTNWIRPGNQELPQGAYYTQGTLYIDNVQPSAAGEYECVTYGLPNRNVLFRIRSRLRVLSPPRITLDPVKQVVESGQNAFIRCIATGDQPITIQWLPVNRTMPASVYTADGYIRFTSIHHRDAGKYQCKARNDAGEADSVAEVVVSYEPEIRKPIDGTTNHTVSSPPGTSVQLNCRRGLNSDLYPVQWRKENDELPENSRLQGSELYIYDLRPENAGRYYCDVHTPQGIVNYYVTLDVSARPQVDCLSGWWRCDNGNCISQDMVCDNTDDCGDNSDERSCSNVAGAIARGPLVKSLPPMPTLHISPETNEYHVGSYIDIKCQSNEPGVIPAWSKLDGGLAENVQNRAGRLTIFNAKPENTGSYRCEATGQMGNYYKDHSLLIKDDPLRDEVPLQVQRAKRRASVLLECNTDLEEPVSYLWSKQGGSLPFYIDQNSKIIQLNSVGSIDAGTYICSATNQRRTLDIPIVLVVTGIIPYFTQAPNSYITLPTLSDAYLQFSFEISFKPENDYGLILYNGNRERERDGDFISLALNNGVPEFRFNLGPGTPTTIVRSNESVAEREWHTIKVVRNKKRVIMYVDGKGPLIGENEGKYFGLDLSEPLFLGGVPDYENISPEVDMERGLVGCISKFKIGYSYQDILHDSLNSTGITNCETCTENKCQNRGTCQEALTTEGYTCICPPKFSGPTCNKRKGQACSPYSCGIGKCVDTAYSFACQCPLGRGGSQCQKSIQVYEPAFKDNAYMAYPPPRPLKRNKIEMKIKPRSVDDALLLYAAETNEGHGDFISLTIKDRHLEFRFDNGKGPVVIRSDEEIVPNKWLAILAIRSPQDGRIVIDGHPSVPKRFSAFFKTLTLLTPLYIGGYDQYSIRLNQGVKVENGFNGCIVDINISGLDEAMMKNITDSSNVEDCGSDDEFENGIPTGYLETSYKPLSFDSRKTGCSDSPCKNNASCIPLSPVEYKCVCLPIFTGKNCETTVDLCESRPCQNDGICKYNSTGFTCDCPLGSGGKTCEQRVELRNDAHFDGNGWLEFRKSLLPHKHENEEEIVALEFSTNTSDGLIFWHGQTPNEDGQGQDYISLGLMNGYLEFSYDLGSGPAIIRNTEIRVDDGQKHSVILKREGRIGSIDIDHNYDSDGESEGQSTTLDCSGNIFLGGSPNVSKMTGSRFTHGFVGCVHGFELQQSKTLDLGMKAINGLNVKPCSSFNDLDNNIRMDKLRT
ncbi:hypothetical protein ABEB36_003476 [Hypothenemus hampei]|uniref:Basement membrane-specific heparan sulfate proteoglycan core protein n=1 Tax=Hypothenemus hampei TaxID=57062 RepID=A0ABD1FCF5_HYPHA